MDLSNENMVHIKKDEIEYLQFRRLLEFDNLINCYTLSVKDVDYKRENNDLLEINNKKIANALYINKDSFVRPYQTHTNCVKKVDNIASKKEERIQYNEVDGLITNKNNINLVLTYADCTPIILYDPIKKVIGNIHSGWKGTVKKIGQIAVLKMIKDFNCNPKDIIACFGPNIGKCHFEVKEDVKNIFEKTFSYINSCCDIITKKEDCENSEIKYLIDTNRINRLLLKEVGLEDRNIIDSKICTVCNSKMLHSYRVDKENAGRNIFLIGMK